MPSWIDCTPPLDMIVTFPMSPTEAAFTCDFSP